MDCYKINKAPLLPHLQQLPNYIEDFTKYDVRNTFFTRPLKNNSNTKSSNIDHILEHFKPQLEQSFVINKHYAIQKPISKTKKNVTQTKSTPTPTHTSNKIWLLASIINNNNCSRNDENL